MSLFSCGRRTAPRCIPRLNSVDIRRFTNAGRTFQADQVAEPRRPNPRSSVPNGDSPQVTKAKSKRTKVNHRLQDPSDVRVTTPNGGAIDLSALILRDMCSCPRCIDPSTKQKHFSTTDIPADIEPAWVNDGPEVLQIGWRNDVPDYPSTHITEFSKKSLLSMSQHPYIQPTQSPIPRSVWLARDFETATTDYEYDQYMSDDSVLLRALRQLHTHGLLFIKNVPEDEQSVETLAGRIGPLKTTFYGRTWDVRSVPDAINVAYTSQNLGFHMDLMYMKQPPHLQLLHCIRSSAAGGASLFSDSFRAASDLAYQDRDALSMLSKRKINFHYDHPGSHYYHQCRYVIEGPGKYIAGTRYHTWADVQVALETGRPKSTGLDKVQPVDLIESISWSPPFQAPFQFPGDWNATNKMQASNLKENVVQWHEAAQEFDKLIHRPKMIYERMMKPGECVIFDNRRVLHARRAFEVGDAGKERWLRGAYIDKDPYISKLHVLRAQLEGEPAEGNVSENPGEASLEAGAAA